MLKQVNWMGAYMTPRDGKLGSTPSSPPLAACWPSIVLVSCKHERFIVPACCVCLECRQSELIARSACCTVYTAFNRRSPVRSTSERISLYLSLSSHSFCAHHRPYNAHCTIRLISHVTCSSSRVRFTFYAWTDRT